MKQRFFVSLLLATALWFVIADARLRIAAFNVQVLGTTKMAKPYVVDILVQIMRRYDIIFIQEIRDATNVVPNQLLAAINQGSTTKYNVTVSARLGRTDSKESYAYYYRNNTNSGIRLIDAWVFNDKNDKFERPPYIAKFTLTTAVSKLTQITLAGIHVKPADALNEILALRDVHADIITRYKTDDVVFFGDMNADCSYLSAAQKTQLAPMYTTFQWLIADKTNTNLAATVCTYDRILAAGTATKSAIVAGTAKPFYFDTAYGLDMNTARNVSDHYPVEFELKNANEALRNLIAGDDRRPAVNRIHA